MKRIDWDSTSDALLVRFWDEGGSLGYVADKMRAAGYDVSRNAIAGRRFRLPENLFSRANGTSAILRTTPERIKKPPPEKKTKMKKEQDEPAISLEGHIGIHYLDLDGFGCKAVMTERSDKEKWGLIKLCGLPRRSDSPYCRGHHQIYNRAPEPVAAIKLRTEKYP